jgi:hypothetical protein
MRLSRHRTDRRTAARRAALVATAALLGASARCGAAQTVSMSVEPGFGGYCKPDRWLPVGVSLVNNGPAAEVEVRATLPSYGNVPQTEYRLPAQLPGPAQRRYELYVQPAAGFNSGNLTVSLVQNRLVVANQPGKLHWMDPNDRLVAVISSESGTLNFLANSQIRLPPGRRPSAMGYGPPGAPPGGAANATVTVQVADVKPEVAPERWKGYDAVDVLVLGSVSDRALSVAQQRAIVEWVHTGGTLVVNGGADAARLKSPFFQGLLPVEVLGTTTARAGGLTAAFGAQLSAPGQRSSFARREPERSDLGSTVVAVCRPKAGATVLSRDGDTPLMVGGRAGGGGVIFLAFDFTRPPFRNWNGAPEIWRGLVRDAGGEPSFLQTLDEAGQGPYGPPGGPQSPYGSGPYGTPGISEACYQLSQLEAPPFALIGSFLFAYILCLVPINYAVLRRRDRKEMAWLTTPAIVLVFTLVAYLIGYGMKGGRVLLARAGVVEGWSGAGTAMAQSYAGLFSPRKTTYDVALDDPSAFLSDASIGPNERSDLKLVREETFRAADAGVDMWSMRLFRVDLPVDLGQGVAVRWSGAGPVRDGVITNNTPFDLEECQILSALAAVPVGHLRPGETRQFRRVGMGGGLGTMLSPSLGSRITGSSSERRMQRTLLQALTALSPGGLSRRFDHPVLMGWTHRPLCGVTVDGHPAREENMNLVLIHLK